MRIRQEQPADYVSVYQLVKLSFATSPHSDGTEPDYLNDVRTRSTFVPVLSLVAEDDAGQLVGQIVLYQTVIQMPAGSRTELVLSPICVHPEYFRRGIATAMMAEAFSRAARQGYGAVFLCGDPEFYRRVGFKPTCSVGIFHVRDDTRAAEWCMVRELSNHALENVQGTIDIE